jgi:hypothetical protein
MRLPGMNCDGKQNKKQQYEGKNGKIILGQNIGKNHPTRYYKKNGKRKYFQKILFHHRKG